MQPKETPPATVIQLAAALAALGAYNGANTEAEHAEEAEHLGGGEAYYRMRLANALLGVAELQALLNETADGPEDGMLLAHEQALQAAGVRHSTTALLEFLRWRSLRIAGPLRQLAQDRATGPIPVAAAWAAEGLQLLLGVTSAGQRLDPATFSESRSQPGAGRPPLRGRQPGHHVRPDRHRRGNGRPATVSAGRQFVLRHSGTVSPKAAS